MKLAGLDKRDGITGMSLRLIQKRYMTSTTSWKKKEWTPQLILKDVSICIFKYVLTLCIDTLEPPHMFRVERNNINRCKPTVE